MYDYDASGMVSNTSFDSEKNFPRVQTPNVLKKRSRYAPPHENQEPMLRKLQRVQYPINKLTYNGYMKMHYNYMVA